MRIAASAGEDFGDDAIVTYSSGCRCLACTVVTRQLDTLVPPLMVRVIKVPDYRMTLELRCSAMCGWLTSS